MRDDEAQVLRALQAELPPAPLGMVGIGDDAAVVSPGGLVISTDTMVEGTHWDARLSPEDVGWKLVAVNVSDLAAMGARPAWAVLALSLPAPLDLAWVTAFARGLGAACRHWQLPVVGGDTTRGPAHVATLTVAGTATRPVLRSTARPGDLLWVSGPLGLAAEAFRNPSASPRAQAWFRRPEPPLGFGIALAETGIATAMMDLSDGLLRDLERLTEASGVGACVDSDALPGEGPLDGRVGFGEDYQLLFTTRADAVDAVQCLAATHVLSPQRVGTLEWEAGVRRADGRPWPSPWFAHFPAAGGSP